MIIPQKEMYIPPESILTIALEFFKSLVTFGFSFLVLLFFKLVFYSLCVLPAVLLLLWFYPGLMGLAVWCGAAGVVCLYILRKAWKGFDL